MAAPVGRKAGRSDTQGNDCVEVARFPVSIGVRDGKNPPAGHLALTPEAFAVLVRRVKAEELNG